MASAKHTSHTDCTSSGRGSRDRMSRTTQTVSIVLGSIIAAAAIVYCAGCVFFYQRFWPNTVIGDAGVSLMTAGDAKVALQQASDERSVNVNGQGVSFTLTGANAGLELNVDAAVGTALAGNRFWQWPVQVFLDHDDSEVLSTSFDTELLRSTIEAQLAAFNSMASDPTDAYIYFDEYSNSFQINPGSMGTKLDVDSVMQTVIDALTARRNYTALTSVNLVQQNIKADDERLLQAQQTANSYLSCNVDLVLPGTDNTVVASITPAVVKDWIVFGADCSVWLDDALLTAWSSQVEDLIDSVGDAREYVRPDGKYVSVPANYKQGTYGWTSDGAGLLDLVRSSVQGGWTGIVEVPIKQSAAVFAPNGADWGTTYIDIDLGEQYVRYYIDGWIVWESACITGEYGVHDTPQGVYYIRARMRDQLLIAVDIDPATGKPEYEVPVDYWMPFIDNMYALHDNPYRADAQYDYGGTYYMNGAGSHGCINLPISKAASLFDIVTVGTPVVVHY